MPYSQNNMIKELHGSILSFKNTVSNKDEFTQINKIKISLIEVKNKIIITYLYIGLQLSNNK